MTFSWGERSNGRVVTYVAVALALVLVYFFLRGSTWQGSTQLHTLMESLATLLALFVGIMAIARFYTQKNSVFLYVGAGFLGTAVLDCYHAVVTSSYFANSFPSAPPSLIPWSWVASRFLLSLSMMLSWLAWVWNDNRHLSKTFSEGFVYTCVGMLTLTSFLFFAFVPLPRAYYPELFFHRPEELVPAVFFLVALIGYLRKGDWKHNNFEHWLIMSLIVGIMGQTVFMSFSSQLFDLEFDAAHLLKKASYVLVLTGLVISMYQLFRREQEQRYQLTAGSEQQEKLANDLKSLNQDLENRVVQRTQEITNAYAQLQEESRKREKQAVELQELNQTLEKRVNERAGQLAEAQGRLRNIIDHVSAAIITVDQEQNITGFNGGAEKIFGYSADEVLGQPMERLIPERFRGGHGAYFQHFATSSDPSRLMNDRGSIYGLKKDGTEFPAEASISKWKFSGEQLYTAILIDSTERQRTQDALKVSEEEQRRLAQENATIAEIGRVFGSSLDATEVYDRFAVELRKLMEFDRILINLVDLEAGEFTVAFHHGLQVEQRGADRTLPIAGSPIEEAITSRQTLIRQFKEDSADPGDVSRYNAGLRCGATVPLLGRGVPVGTLSLQSCHPDAFGQREKAVLELLANHIGPAIQNAKLYEQTLVAQEKARQLAEEASVVAKIGRIINSSLATTEVYDRFVLELKKLVEFDRMAVNLIDWQKNQYTLTFHHGEQVEGRELGVPVPLKGSTTEKVVAQRKCAVEEYRHDSQDPEAISRFQTGLRSAITVPLIMRDRHLGAMTLHSRRPHAYGEREKAVLEKLAYQVAPAIENAGLYEEARQMGEDLQERAEALGRSNAELEQFAYVASHDLQEPLRSISGFTRLLTRHLQDNMDEESRRLMDRVSGATTRMQELIRDLLAYSRVGRNVENLESVDSESMLSQALVHLEAAIEDAGATVAHDPLPMVMAHPSLLGQLLQNLIANGIKFRGNDPPHIHVSAKELENEWQFCVKDNGIGISPEFSERIFTIFQRLHTREQYAGSGIGLAMCKKAVERMGGSIWVESEPHQGSAFYFTVPKVTGTRPVAASTPVIAGD